jgi:hypothetical protein
MKAKVKSIRQSDAAIGLVTRHGILWLSKNPKYAEGTARILKLAFPKLKPESWGWGVDLEELVGKFALIHLIERERQGVMDTIVVAGG